MAIDDELAAIEGLLQEKPRKTPRKSRPFPTLAERVQTYTVNTDKSPTGGRRAWPFADMKKGNWIAVKDETEYQKARLAASACGKRKGWKFTCKMSPDKSALIVTRVS